MNKPLKNFRETLQVGGAVYGVFMKTADPMFVEAAGFAGLDYVILDMEHGPTSLENQQHNIRAAEISATLPIVRTKDMNENTIGSVLDIGAAGIQVPQVSTAEEAAKVVRYARFHPHGMRGVCRYVRAAQYTNCPREIYFANSKDILVILQLEGKKAIENLDEIMEVDGIDILFIGPYDLSQSLGVPGQVTHPLVQQEMSSIIARARAKGKVLGTFVDNLEQMVQWRDVGVQYLSYSVDVGIFMQACKSIVHECGSKD